MQGESANQHLRRESVITSVQNSRTQQQVNENDEHLVHSHARILVVSWAFSPKFVPAFALPASHPGGLAFGFSSGREHEHDSSLPPYYPCLPRDHPEQ
jgi:hypothetical protein